MKKLFTLLVALMLSITATISMIGCGDPNPDARYSVYVPDGAPALSVARILHDETAVKKAVVNVVPATTIQTFVTGESPKADVCIMPVNAASKLLGNASTYQMLGVVTNGNLFIMKKQSGVNIDKTNLSELIGKKVGALNIANVIGLTFKSILLDSEIPFVDITNGGEVQADKVNLVGLANGTQVVPNSDCDYFIVAEPAATTKQNATQGKLSIAGSLQALYGEGNGFPQAVVVAKKSVIESDSYFINDLINSFDKNADWLKDKNTSMEDVVNAVKSGFSDSDTAPTFTANNLNKTVIENCSISFRKAKDAKTDVLNYIAKLNGVVNNWGTPVDAFFYNA